MMRKLSLFTFLITTFVMSNHVSANYYCVGKVSYVGVDGNVFISNGFGVHRMCALDSEKCKAWLSMAMAARLADKVLAIYYESDAIGGNQSAGACADIGTWITPSDRPYHIQL